MTDPFTLLKDALANVIGASPDIAGYILGAVLTVALLIILEWTLGGGKGDRGNLIFIISGGLGVALSTLFGWFPAWVVVFIAIMVLFLIIKPFGGRGTDE